MAMAATRLTGPSVGGGRPGGPVYRAPVEWALGPLWPIHDPDRPTDLGAVDGEPTVRRFLMPDLTGALRGR